MNNLRFNPTLTDYLPDWYKPISDYQAILNAESTELTAAETALLNVYGNLFFLTMDAGAISQWEQVFSITPSPDETLEFRRDRILNRVAMKPPLGFSNRNSTSLSDRGFTR